MKHAPSLLLYSSNYCGKFLRGMARDMIIVIVVVACGSVCAGDDVWFRINKEFAQQIDKVTGAGKITSRASHPLKRPHAVSCSGEDGELHIGVDEPDLSWTQNGQQVSSGLGTGHETQWGMVVEPVNLTSQQNKKIHEVASDEVTFSGWYRLWNEGHWKGQYAPSNPHHVLELHPAWSYTSDAGSADLVRNIHSIAGYSGYGASHFKPLFKSLVDDDWLVTYEDTAYVYIQLRQFDNFYQLPVVIRSNEDAGQFRLLKVDVYSDKAHSHKIYDNLQVVALNNDFFSGLEESQKTFLLGIFSVNPRAAMELAQGHSENDPVNAAAALQFFAYGFPTDRAVKNSDCDYE